MDGTAPMDNAEGQVAAASSDDLLLGPDSDATPAISVVLPTLNEEDGIGECIDRIEIALEEMGVTGEVIVSDSSTDRTPEIARERGAIVVEPDEDGYGYAYRYGFEHARGEYIVMGDADTTYDFTELPRLFNPIEKGEADIVMGSRLSGEIRDGAMPWLHQHVGNPLLTTFLNLFYDANVSDAHSGFRVFDADVLDDLDLRTDGMEFASEMVMDAATKDLKITEVPITYHEREGEATLSSLQDGWRHVKFMLMNAPGYLFSLPGLLLFTLGSLLLGFAITGVSFPAVRIGSVWDEGLQFGLRSAIAGSLLAIIGYHVASMGVFATIVGDPIRRPEDRFTTLIVDHMTLERGATIGLILFGLGGAYAGYLVVKWVTAGYEALPALPHDVVAFTLIVLGIQTVFASFFLSTIADA